MMDTNGQSMKYVVIILLYVVLLRLCSTQVTVTQEGFFL